MVQIGSELSTVPEHCREEPLISNLRQVRTEPWLSVVIPAKDESERLPETLRLLTFNLKSLIMDFEIIVVDDGSTCGTYDEMAKMFDAPIRFLRHEKSRGIAAAFRSGAQISKGEHIMLCPADICDFSFLSYALGRCKNAEIISVSKRHPQSSVIGYNKWRWFLSNNYHRMVTVLFNIPKTCRDTHYIKIYRSDLLRKILPLCMIDGAVGETEMVYYASKMDARMEDVPGKVIHNHNHSKTSLRKIAETFIDLMKLWIRVRTTNNSNHYE